MRALLTAALLLGGATGVALPAAAQAPAAPPPAAPAVAPTAAPADVSSPDAILAAVYGVISGEAGAPRDWDRFRSLFAPGARLIPTGPRKAGGSGVHATTPDEFVASADPVLKTEGFYEREIARRSERFGPVMHVWSTYDTRHSAADQPFQRGINSFQLFFDGTRWWVVTIYWAGETPAQPIPPEYLGGR